MLISRITFGISIYASASRTELNRVKVAYNDCLRAIKGGDATNKRKKTSIRDLHRSLALPTFPSLVKYFDIVLFKGIIEGHYPYHLYKHIDQSYLFNTRASNNGMIKLKFVPRNERANRSFLVRAVKAYNALPIEIKSLRSGEKFKLAVKKFLYEREIQDTVEFCKLS